MKKIILLFALVVLLPLKMYAQNDLQGNSSGEVIKLNTVKKLGDISRCPKYIVYRKKVVTSSTRGEISNTGWVYRGIIESCDKLSKDPERITNDIRYIKQGGFNEEGIITEEYVRYDNPIDVCEASEVTTERKMSFPPLVEFTKTAEKVGGELPRVRKFSIVFNPIVTVKKGEECCELNSVKKPVTYTEVKAGIEAKFDLQVYLQGGKISFSQSFWAAKVEGSLELASYLNPFSKGKIEVVGKTYDLAGTSGNQFNNASNCAACNYIGYKGDGGIKVALILEGRFGIYAWDFIDKEWMEQEEIVASAELSGTLGAKINATYASGLCSKPKPGLHFSGSLGELKGNFKMVIKFLGFNPEFSFERIFFDGYTFDR